jgi:hypothetical protein
MSIVQERAAQVLVSLETTVQRRALHEMQTLLSLSPAY